MSKKEQIITVCNDNYGDLRVLVGCGGMKFAAQDICTYLNIDQSRIEAVRVEKDQIRNIGSDAEGQTLCFMSIGGIARLTSRKSDPRVRSYKQWISDIVRPQAEEEAKRQKILQEEAAMYEGAISVEDFAAQLESDDVYIDRNSLFAWLRKNHFLGHKRDYDWNYPTQKSEMLGLFVVRKGKAFNSTAYNKPLVTPKGQEYLREKLIGELAGPISLMHDETYY